MYVTATVRRARFRTPSPCRIPPSCATARTSRSSMPRHLANQFGRRAVTLGESQNGQTQITGGLKAGDQVIGNGSLFLQFANSLQR
jgi:hypothetical protein